MKSKIALLVAVALLVFVGLAAAQATITWVKGQEIPVQLVNPGEVKCNQGTPTGNPFMPCPPGTSGTLRGQERIAREETTDSRLNGLNYVTANANMHPNGNVSVWGTFRIVVTEGGEWEGVWEGRQLADGSATYQATGHGSGGNIEGLQLLWYGVYQPGNPIGDAEARILTPGKSTKP